jgi:hypothetical protein
MGDVAASPSGHDLTSTLQQIAMLTKVCDSKPTDMRGDCYAHMQAELIMESLGAVLEALIHNVQPCLQWLAEVDVCMSLADVSSQQSLTRPKLVEDNVLQIEKGVTSCTRFSCHHSSLAGLAGIRQTCKCRLEPTHCSAGRQFSPQLNKHGGERQTYSCCHRAQLQWQVSPLLFSPSLS